MVDSVASVMYVIVDPCQVNLLVTVHVPKSTLSGTVLISAASNAIVVLYNGY